MELVEALSRQPHVSELPLEDRELLASLATDATLPAGARLTDEGSAVSSLWVLVDGRVRVEVGDGATRTTIAELGPGSLLGEASYLSGRPATATVIALGECLLVEVEQARLRTECEERPEFGLRVERALVAVFTERLSRSLGVDSRAELPVVDADILKSLRTLELESLEEEAIARYARFGNRNPFLWRWCLRALELTVLPTVPAARRIDTRTTKFLAAVTLVIVDDVADLGESAHELDEVLALLGETLANGDPQTIDPRLRKELEWMWSSLGERTSRLPEYEALEPVLAFDWRMVFTANRHAWLARESLAVVNPTENMEYAPHGIAMMVFGTLDLMSSPRLTLADSQATREVVHAGQALCELANMIATWRREIPDRDFGSRIFTLGLTRGTFTGDELRTLESDAIVARIEEARLEELLLDEWRSHRTRAEAAATRIDGYDPSLLLAGYDAVFGMTLAARGSI
jgi:CRP-like cAMP-binding protein